jgi:hypothetical protein
VVVALEELEYQYQKEKAKLKGLKRVLQEETLLENRQKCLQLEKVVRAQKVHVKSLKKKLEAKKENA